VRIVPYKNATAFWTHNRFDPVTGCWNWTGAHNGGGYGHKYHNGRQERVHRLAAHFYLGFDLKSSLQVLHRCDNPACFNPKHLFIGTQLENMKDCVEKGRLNVAHFGHRCSEETKRKMSAAALGNHRASGHHHYPKNRKFQVILANEPTS
jgi:hypothetical protein